MGSVLNRRMVLVSLVSGFSLLMAASQTFAHATVEGRWVARLPGGISVYHFHAANHHPDDTYQGRFDHTFIDDLGVERTVHGTYLFSHVGNRGRLTLLFDDGSRTTDIEHRGEGTLLLRHVGSGRMIAYIRQ